DAHAVARDRAALDQPLQVFEQLRVVVGVGRRAMQLQQVEGLDLQVAAAAVDPLLQVLRGVAGHLLPGQATPGLGRHERALAAALLEHARDQALGMAVAVHVGGVDEIQAGIQRRVQRGDRLAVVDRAPGRADRPGAEADLADCVAGTAESSGTHAWTPGTGRAGRQRGREKDRGAVAPDEHRIIAATCEWARRRRPGTGARLRHDPGDAPAPGALPTPLRIEEERCSGPTQHRSASLVRTRLRANHESRITNHESPITNDKSPITNHPQALRRNWVLSTSPLIFSELPSMCSGSPSTRRMLRITVPCLSGIEEPLTFRSLI